MLFRSSKLYFASLDEDPTVEYGYMSQRQKISEVVQPAEFIEVKGWKALGNKLVDKKLISIKEQAKAEEKEEDVDDEESSSPTGGSGIQADLFGSPAKNLSNVKKQEKETPGSGKSKPPAKGKSKGNGYLNTGDTIEFDV